jgi:hypothetical protein
VYYLLKLEINRVVSITRKQKVKMAVTIYVKTTLSFFYTIGTISWFIYTEVYLAKRQRTKEKIATAEPTRI